MSTINPQDYQTFRTALHAKHTPSELEKACAIVLPILLGLTATLPMMYLHFYGSR